MQGVRDWYPALHLFSAAKSTMQLFMRMNINICGRVTLWGWLTTSWIVLRCMVP